MKYLYIMIVICIMYHISDWLYIVLVLYINFKIKAFTKYIVKWKAKSYMAKSSPEENQLPLFLRSIVNYLQ